MAERFSLAHLHALHRTLKAHKAMNKANESIVVDMYSPEKLIQKFTHVEYSVSKSSRASHLERVACDDVRS